GVGYCVSHVWSVRFLFWLPSSFFFLLIRVPPISPLFPYTTLFRSQHGGRLPVAGRGRAGADLRGLNCMHAWASAAEIVKAVAAGDRKSTRLNSSHQIISYAVFCLKKKKQVTY